MKSFVILLLILIAPAALAGPLDAPLHVRNTSPMMGLYGLPRAQGEIAEQGVQWLMSVDYANSFSGSRRGGDAVALDGETMTAALSLKGGFGTGWEWGIEVPYISHRRSNLDSLFDEWHDFFGFPDGGRHTVPRGRLEYSVQADGVTYAAVRSPSRGLGDVRVWVGRALYTTENSAGALRLQIKAPTGDESELRGSGATDAALWWEHNQQGVFGHARLGLSAALGAAYLGEGELLPDEQNRVVGLASLGLRYRLTDRVTFNLQADMHGAPVDTPLEELGHDGVQGTIGGRILLSDDLWVDLGVVENLKSASAPDAVFLLHLGGRW